MAQPNNKLNTPHALLIGIGNTARRDDGLGWVFLETIRQQGNFAGEMDYRYQLQVEDAEVIRNYQTVIFVDALHEPAEGGFYWKPCLPVATFGFSTHALEPGSVVALCQEVYGAAPLAFTLGIAGHAWGLEEGLSPEGKENLKHALHFFRENIL